jgi:hypothetical protein
MKLTIFGEHTAPYCEPPYEMRREFEAALQSNWSAVEWFGFDSTTAAEVSIRGSDVADMTVRQVLDRLAVAVRAASLEVDWDIWAVEGLD